MSTETQVITLASPAQTAANLNSAIFRDHAAEGFGRKVVALLLLHKFVHCIIAIYSIMHLSLLQQVRFLFPGVGFGAAYKILQRVYKFGGQPVVLDAMTKRFGADFDERFGHKTGRTLLSATSGSIIGIGEGKWNLWE